jgi:hypothetical protein
MVATAGNHLLSSQVQTDATQQQQQQQQQQQRHVQCGVALTQAV